MAGVFGLSLVSALLLALLPAGGLAQALGRRPALDSAADGVDNWLVIDLLTSSLTDATLGGESAAPELANATDRLLLTGMLTMLIMPILAWLFTAFLTGGVALTYLEQSSPFRWRRLLWGCWHWFGSFLLLGIGQTVISVVLLGPLSAFVLVIGLRTGWLLWVGMPLLVLIIALFRSVFEWARVIAVTTRTRHIGRAFSSAVRMIVQHPGDWGTVYGLTLLLLAALYGMYRWAVLPHLPPKWWTLVLGVQQVFMLAWLWAWLARLAGGAALAAEWLPQDRAGTVEAEA